MNTAMRLRTSRSTVTPLLATLSLFLITSGTAAPPAPVVRFEDAAVSRGLDFVGEVGDTYAFLINPNGVSILHILQRAMGNGAAVGDYDRDGDLDVLMLGQLNRPNALFRNDLDLGAPGFTNVTPANLLDTGLTRVAHFADFDNDAWPDLVLVNDDWYHVYDGTVYDYYPHSRIMRNNRDGTFTDVTAGSGFNPIGYYHAGCAIADYDLDGRLDIYVTVWTHYLGSGPPALIGTNRLYRNLGGFVFEDVTETPAAPPLMNRDSFSAIFKDLNEDGLPDIHIAVDHSADSQFLNTGGGFTDVSAAVGVLHTGNDMGIACADFDDDGDLDMYQTNITDPLGQLGTTQGNAFYVNQLTETGSAVFVDQAAARGVFDTAWGWGTEFLDAENDSDLDLVAVNGYDEFILLVRGPSGPLYQTPSYLFINDGTGNFARLTGTDLDLPDDSRGVVIFDYDRDGDEDILVSNVGQPVRLFENLTEGQGRWLHVKLGPDSKAVGATVFATIGERTLRRDIIYGRSYLAGTPPEVHFGLGEAALVDALRVRWNDGVEQTLSSVAADQIIEICRFGTDGEGLCAASPGAGPTPSPTPPACCVGDADNSKGFVDALDFICVQANFGADNGIGAPGDADCSGGLIDALDFIAVQAAFGAECP